MDGIVAILGEYLLLYLFLKNSAIVAMNEIKTNFKLFSKHYCLPPVWIRKHFKLKKTEIPKFLLFRLYVAMFFLVSAPIAVIICLVSQFNFRVIGSLMFFPGLFVLIDNVVFIILYFAFKK